MTSRFCWQKTWLVFGTAVAVTACSMGPQITKTLEVPESADTPYSNILIIGLFSSFSTRRKFEKEVVRQLTALGTDAVASTSMMDPNTPATRQTFLAMVEKLDADAVMVTQVASLKAKAEMKDMSPEATYNVGATYYYNVWTVELTEYVEPQSIEVQGSLVLATQFFSVLKREAVWAIESKSQVVQQAGRAGNYAIIEDEVTAMVKHISRDGLIAN